jgi:peroxiredoxin
MESTLEAPHTPAPVDSPRGRLAEHKRAIVAGLAVVVLAPLAWYAGTRPLGNAAGGVVSLGGAAQGVGPQAGKAAPDFKLQDPGGKTVELKQYRGRPVLLNFWATWCAPCKEEMPELEQLYRQYENQGLVVLGVSVDDSSSVKQVPGLLKEGNPSVGSYTFPIALDEKQEVTRQYKLFGVPSSFFVDRDGVIRVVQPRVMSREMMLDGLKHILPNA